eukprot:7212573-Karenia_brevis.AAC.1
MRWHPHTGYHHWIHASKATPTFTEIYPMNMSIGGIGGMGVLVAMVAVTERVRWQGPLGSILEVGA